MTLQYRQALIGISVLLAVLTASACDVPNLTQPHTSSDQSTNGTSGGPSLVTRVEGAASDGSSLTMPPDAKLGPALQATPELDSLLLFGAGLLTSAGYVYRRRLARP